MQPRTTSDPQRRSREASRTAVTALERRIAELEQSVATLLERGEEPGPELRDEYERVFSELQSSPIYQGLVAAQSNFEKVMYKVNQTVAQGIEEGAQSRIIISS